MHIFKHIEREEGQGLVEYALLLVLVAVIVIAILAILGSSVVFVFARVVGGLNGDTIDDGAVYLGATVTENVVGGSCQTKLTDVKYLATDANGNVKTNDSSVTVKIFANGVQSQSVSGASNGNGVVTVAGPVTVVGSGSCPLKITMAN